LSTQNQAVLQDFLRAFLLPLLINKGFMLYFGLNYASNPGDGYGYGLTATIIFMILTLGRFLWKYKDIEDP
jgi:hypothetical protein